MKRIISYIATAAIALLPIAGWALGVPLLTNYTASEYGAHNNNFDILPDSDGIVYVANFEGLLYFDKAQWRTIHTPGITRITTVYRDRQKRIWAGGHNFLGYVESDRYGRLQLHPMNTGNLKGEVVRMQEDGPQLQFVMSNGETYRIEGDNITKISAASDDNNHNVSQCLTLEDGLKITVKPADGIVIENSKGQVVCHFNEENGLCSNSVNRIAYDGHGTLWGATAKGIFALAIPSKYSRYTAAQGLKGEISDIESLDSVMYVSTTNGVYRENGLLFEPVEGISHACWQLYQKGHSLLAATSVGVYSISPNGTATRLSNESATAVMGTPDLFYSGELNGVVLNAQGSRTVVGDIEKATNIYLDEDHTLWVEDIYGQVWRKPLPAAAFSMASQETNISTMVISDKKVTIVAVSDSTDYPQFSQFDKMGYTWMTNYEGKMLHVVNHGQPVESFNEEIAPFADYVIKALYHQRNFLWIGGEFGLITIGHQFSDASLTAKPMLRIRSVTLNTDSVVWGGFGQMPSKLATFDSHDRNVTICYALDYPSYAGKTYYRYRLNEGVWSAWSTLTTAHFSSLASDNYTFEVQAIDPFGRISEPCEMTFSIDKPFYMQWYMVLLYLLLLALLVYAFAKWRTRRLKAEKDRLEDIVLKRTAEVTKQKDEIEEKSNRLQSALDELAKAQKKLIRQEKMATAGKLTQGLIDRILNPMNYINNFSKLSCGLLKDLKANIEDEEEHMDKDNFDDTMDVIDMLDQNLQKVEQHGLNTTRTLKAMEEILKDRSGGLVPLNLCSVLKQDEEMVQTYYKEQIAADGINVTFSLPDHEILINGNADQLSKTFMSLLGNGIYAVDKKYGKKAFAPEVSVTVETNGMQAILVFRDNGIGIEPSIIDKIFDPFFTTKTTGEASGVGLYLSHEIVQNHGGEITVESQKDEYTAFTITLPILQN